ncbi:MAG TPA: sugar phosphate isomerase/epimerase [Puia sp.]|nr:sugar phosphate isomerase/epimerase [Puia sp.]
MTSRRRFIQSASALSAVAFMKGPSVVLNKEALIGLQLYTVRDAMVKDPAGTLAHVAKIGYNSVESATYTGSQQFYGMDPRSFKKLLKDNGLVIPSGHYRLGAEKTVDPVKGTMLHEWQRAVDDAAAVGLKYMVCAYLAEDERGDPDHYKVLAEQFNTAAEVCKKAGIQFCYHNHDFEFKEQHGELPYNVLLNNTDKDLVKMELDIYWATRAGHDPIELFKQHPGRFPLWHVKDMSKSADRTFTEVGNGSIDFRSIFQRKSTAGMKYFFVEQDICPGSPFDSITQSYNYIKKNLV